MAHNWVSRNLIQRKYLRQDEIDSKVPRSLQTLCTKVKEAVKAAGITLIVAGALPILVAVACYHYQMNNTPEKRLARKIVAVRDKHRKAYVENGNDAGSDGVYSSIRDQYRDILEDVDDDDYRMKTLIAFYMSKTFPHANDIHGALFWNNIATDYSEFSSVNEITLLLYLQRLDLYHDLLSAQGGIDSMTRNTLLPIMMNLLSVIEKIAQESNKNNVLFIAHAVGAQLNLFVGKSEVVGSSLEKAQKYVTSYEGLALIRCLSMLKEFLDGNYYQVEMDFAEIDYLIRLFASDDFSYPPSYELIKCYAEILHKYYSVENHNFGDLLRLIREKKEAIQEKYNRIKKREGKDESVSSLFERDFHITQELRLTDDFIENKLTFLLYDTLNVRPGIVRTTLVPPEVGDVKPPPKMGEFHELCIDVLKLE